MIDELYSHPPFVDVLSETLPKELFDLAYKIEKFYDIWVFFEGEDSHNFLNPNYVRWDAENLEREMFPQPLSRRQDQGYESDEENWDDDLLPHEPNEE